MPPRSRPAPGAACPASRREKRGTAWSDARTLIVPDVDKFPGHIACNSASRSEIVVPLKKNDSVYAVLDIDSDTLNSFDETDKLWLEKIVGIL